MIDLSGCDDEQIAKILRLVATQEGIGLKDLAERLNLKPTQIYSYTRAEQATTMKSAERRALEVYINDLAPAAVDAVRACANESSRGAAAPARESDDPPNGRRDASLADLAASIRPFLRWIELDAIGHSQITKHGSGPEHGAYFIMRLAGPKGESLRCGLMLVIPPGPTSPLPQFLTIRRWDDTPRFTRGVMFEVGDDIYSIGQLRGSHGLRFTRMRFVRLHRVRRDMFGLRLSATGDSELSSAHRIYAYQLQRKRERSVVNAVIGQDHPRDSELLRGEINGLDRIVKLLARNRMYEGGFASEQVKWG